MATPRKAYYKHHEKATDADVKASVKTREAAISTQGQKIIIKTNAGTFLEMVTNFFRDARSYASFAAALTDIGATAIELVVSSTITLTANATVPANVHLRIAKGGSIALAGFTLTINGTLVAGEYQIFSGSGSVANLKVALPVWFGADTTGATDCLTAAQNAHNALSSNGGRLLFSGGTYLITGSARYILITKDNVKVEFADGALLVSESSDDPELTVQAEFNIGFTISGDNCIVDGMNLRGGLIGWNPTELWHRLTIKNSRFYNIHNAALGLGELSKFSQLVVENCDFDTSLATSSANYSAIQRGDQLTTSICGTAYISGCRFRGVSGGVNLHKTSQVVIKGCRFEGVNYFAVKMAQNVAAAGDQDLSVEGCYFDGNAIDLASANRHLSCSGLTVPDYSDAAGFIQVFNKVHIRNCVFKDYQGNTLNFLDKSLLNASIDITGNEFDNCVKAIRNLQGMASVMDNTFTTCDLQLNEDSGVRGREFIIERNRFTDTKLYIGNTSFAALQNIVRIRNNQFSYTLDNTGAIECDTISGAPFDIVVLCEENYISVSGGGNTVGIGGAQVQRVFTKGNILVGSTTKTGTIDYPHYILDRAAGAGAYSIDTSPDAIGVPFSTLSLLNTNATGDHTYTIDDTVYKVGDTIRVQRTNATYDFTLVVSSSGTINGTASIRAFTRYSSGTLRKIATGVWRLFDMEGVWIDANGALNQFGDRVQFKQGANITSASDITLGYDGNQFLVTGTTTIDRISTVGWRAGARILLQFDGLCQVNHNGVATGGGFARILLTTGTEANFLPAITNARLELYYDGTDWREIGRGAGDITATSRIKGKKGADVASAGDLTLGAGNYFIVSGTATINGIATANWQAGSIVVLQFSGAATLAHNTAPSAGFALLLLNGSTGRTVAAGSTAMFAWNGTQWSEIPRAA